MFPDSSLIIPILEKLLEKYPLSISSYDKILPDHENQQEILNHLHYCRDKGWIEAQPIKEDAQPLPVEYVNILITTEGIDYLNAWLKKS